MSKGPPASSAAPTTPSPTPAPAPQPVTPAAPPADLPSLWNAVLETLANRPSMSWLKSLAPQQLTDTTLRLVTQPGHRQMLSFVTDARKDQLRDLVATILGRRVKIEVAVPEAGGQDPGADAGSPGADSGRSASTAAQRREAMSLPLVRQVIDLFDATLTDVKSETEGEKNDV